MNKLTILMSTYNGHLYLDEQLESIYKQEGLNEFEVNIVIRDDGSMDDTVQIIKKWSERMNITFYCGDNIGARNSFFWLITNAPESDYYAFCDQDDIWKSNKLSISIKRIKEVHSSATLFFSNLEYIDGKGKALNKNMLNDEFRLSLERVFMCNPANGCTMVWDKDLHGILKTVPYDTFTMHDEFACTVAMTMGQIIYDPVPSMYYRIHNDNVTQTNSLRKKLKTTKQIWLERKPYSIDKRAKMLLDYNINGACRDLLLEISNYRKGICRYKIAKHFKCENSSINRSFKIRVLLGLA